MRFVIIPFMLKNEEKIMKVPMNSTITQRNSLHWRTDKEDNKTDRTSVTCSIWLYTEYKERFGDSVSAINDINNATKPIEV